MTVDTLRVDYLIRSLRANKCWPHERMRRECADMMTAMSEQLERERAMMLAAIALVGLVAGASLIIGAILLWHASMLVGCLR